MRNFLPSLLCVASLAILPAVAYAHGSNVFESETETPSERGAVFESETEKPSEHGAGQHVHAATHTGHAADASAEEFEELHDEIAHLEERLIAHDQRVRMTDIVGGIGYIVGITGAAYYYLGSRRKKQP